MSASKWVCFSLLAYFGILFSACMVKKHTEKAQHPANNPTKKLGKQNIEANNLPLSVSQKIVASPFSLPSSAKAEKATRPKMAKPIQAPKIRTPAPPTAPLQELQIQKVKERVEQLDLATRSKQFHIWKTYLDADYASYLNSQDHFAYLEKKYQMSKIGITVCDFRSYFLNVVVPSHQGSNTDNLEFVYTQNENREQEVQIFLPIPKNLERKKILLYCMQTQKIQPERKEWFVIACK